MGFLNKVKDGLAALFPLNEKGEPDLDKMWKELFIKTIANRETSFAIIGIRCNTKDSVGKRKMDPGRLYLFLQGYHIADDSIEVDGWRFEQNRIYDDYYTELVDGKPHIQISAIVGQNGSGKSSIVEFMMRLINNFAATTIGEKQLVDAAERLHFIDKVDGELWYMLGGYPYHLIVKNAYVRLNKFAEAKEEACKVVYSQEETVFDNGGDANCEKLEKVLNSEPKNKLLEYYSNFFYTLVSNQSVYAYNTNDYYYEYNDNEKENAAQCLDEKKTFSDEERCWLHGIFHKNDGYKTPMVVTPYRFEGNMDINKENLLATERLVSLLAVQTNLRKVNGHLLAQELTYSYLESDEDCLTKVKELGFNKLTEDGYLFLRKHIIEAWESALGKNISANLKQRPFFEQAIDYIVYKTLKVSRNYEGHHVFFEKNNNMTDQCEVEAINALVRKQVADHSHITRKIFQTIAYLWYEVYDIKEKRNAAGKLIDSSDCMTFDELGEKWHRKVFKEEGAEKDMNRFYIQRQALMVPPFLRMRIDLCEEDNPDEIIDFETLSSGEKQQIYSISSILYHLDNLKSAQKDESNPDRIVYKYVNVVLEEIELYYHPELQQQFVRYLIDGLDQVDLEGIIGINIIIVTHSPYVLSDIPRTNVLALRKNEVEPESNLKTFGANIHDLLKNSFFLTEGSIGKFAQWEVSHILACIDVHRWANKKGVDTRICPLIDDDENQNVYQFLKRYTYEDTTQKRKLFSYEYFCEDLSLMQLKERIQLVDEPVIYQILMRKLVELEKIMEKSDVEA